MSCQSENGLVTEMSFKMQLLEAILKVLPETPLATSAGAVYSLFKLLTGVAASADPLATGNTCIELLTKISNSLNENAMHSHRILRAR